MNKSKKNIVARLIEYYINLGHITKFFIFLVPVFLYFALLAQTPGLTKLLLSFSYASIALAIHFEVFRYANAQGKSEEDSIK